MSDNEGLNRETGEGIRNKEIQATRETEPVTSYKYINVYMSTYRREAKVPEISDLMSRRIMPLKQGTQREKAKGKRQNSICGTVIVRSALVNMDKIFPSPIPFVTFVKKKVHPYYGAW